MALATEKLGTTWTGEVQTVDPDRARAYAAATNDDNPAYLSGALAPPLFAVVPTWQTMSDALTAMVPSESFLMIVHGEQDMHFHQPLVPGQRLSTTAEAYSVRVGRSGTRYTMKVLSESVDTASLVVEQYVTMFIRGMSDGETAGPDKPDHGFPRGVRSRPVGTHTVHIDEDQTYRYREASGDDNAIHLDPAVAASVGLPGIIVHGLCTMAMTSQAVIATVAAGDPARLRRLAVRFSRPVFPGSDLVTTMYDAGVEAGRHLFAFEAHCGAELVISNGRADVSP